MSLPMQIVEFPTGAGDNELTTVPSGIVNPIGLKKPELIGMSSNTTLNALYTQEPVLPGRLLTKPLVCGCDPVKSTFTSSPRT